MRIGAHESVAGGLHLAFERATADGAEAVQIFTRSSRQWVARPLEPDEVRLFRAAQATTGLPVLVHASYLVNLGAEPGDVRTKSVAAFRDELERCALLGAPWLVVHPGANADEPKGLELIAEGVREALAATSGVGVLLEITAGQGVSLGHRFEHLATLLERVGSDRVGVCLDTCHLVAAGYDLTTDDAYEDVMRALERLIGFSQVKALHLNDAKKGLGSRVDRHDHIGDGTLGLATFARIVNDARFGDIPAVLETPEGRWADEIRVLKSLRAGRSPEGAAGEVASPRNSGHLSRSGAPRAANVTPPGAAGAGSRSRSSTHD